MFILIYVCVCVYSLGEQTDKKIILLLLFWFDWQKKPISDIDDKLEEKGIQMKWQKNQHSTPLFRDIKGGKACFLFCFPIVLGTSTMPMILMNNKNSY